jgi:type II secretory pathway component GspD/PulD (secretin)
VVGAEDGSTIVIGGIIQERGRDNYGKIPLLGDIPGLGWLFRNQEREVQKIELVILMTITVIER